MTVTTIGYGDICPTTPAGKAVCAAAALSGIGYFGIIFEILRDFRARSLESKVLESVRMKGTAGMLLTTLTAGVLLCYYLRAHGTLPTVEEADAASGIFEATYWTIITTTSVGYGDLYPSTDSGKFVVCAFAIWSLATAAILEEMSERLKSFVE